MLCIKLVYVKLYMICYSGPNVRKLSKIASIMLARNYIVQLQLQIHDLKQALVEERLAKGESWFPLIILSVANSFLL